MYFGKKNSPFVMLQVLARVVETESSRDVAEEFGIDKSTINRWRAAFLSTPDVRKQLVDAERSLSTLLAQI